MIRKLVGLIIGLGLMAAMFGGAAAFSNYGQCVSGGGTVSGTGADQVCSITQTESGTVEGSAGFYRETTTTTTTSISPGGAPVTSTETTVGPCLNNQGNPVSESNPNCP
jgi:hypothetical protein